MKEICRESGKNEKHGVICKTKKNESTYKLVDKKEKKNLTL